MIFNKKTYKMTFEELYEPGYRKTEAKRYNKAKELGIADAEKLFRVRGEEAKDFGGIVGKVSQQIDTALRSI